MKASVTLQDIALVQMQGGTIGATVEYPGFSNRRNAERAAQRDLRALATPLLSCTVYCGQEASNLDIGDTFKLEWPDYHEGAIVMRVTGMAFGDGRTDRIKIDCVQDVFAAPQDAILSDDRENLWQNPSAPPQNIEEIDGNESDELVAATTQIAVEMPYRELREFVGPDEVDGILSESPGIGLLQTSGKRPASGSQESGTFVGNAINALIHVNAGSGYVQEGTADFCAFARLSTDIGFLTSEITVFDAERLSEVRIGSFAQIGDELVRVDATIGNTITIGRGILDTVPTTHAAGASILFWQDAAGTNQIEYEAIQAVLVKLQPRNGSGVAPLASAVAMPLSFDSRAIRPYPPGNVRINGVAYPEYVDFDPISDPVQIDFYSLFPFFFGDVRFYYPARAGNGKIRSGNETFTGETLQHLLGADYYSADSDSFPSFESQVPINVGTLDPQFSMMTGYAATGGSRTFAMRLRYCQNLDVSPNYVVGIYTNTTVSNKTYLSTDGITWDVPIQPVIQLISVLEEDELSWSFGAYYAEWPVWMGRVGSSWVLITKRQEPIGYPQEEGVSYTFKNYMRVSADGQNFNDSYDLIDLPGIGHTFNSVNGNGDGDWISRKTGPEPDATIPANQVGAGATQKIGPAIWLSNEGILLNQTNIAVFDGTFILATETGKTFHASDLLGPWTDSSLDVQIEAFAATATAIVAAEKPSGGDIRLWRSTNGTTWTNVQTISSVSGRIEKGFIQSGVMVFIGSSGAYRSADDGLTWTREDTPDQAGGSFLTLPNQDESGTIWALQAKANIRPILVRSDDAGQSWERPASESGVEISVQWSHRDRLQQTLATFEDTTLGNIGPEVGTSYSLAVFSNPFGALRMPVLAEGITGTQHVISFVFQDNVDYFLRLWSVRDGYASWQQHVIPVLRAPLPVESSSELVSESEAYEFETFTASGTWDWTAAGQPAEVDVFIVGGGGGGGGWVAAGGGGGGRVVSRLGLSVNGNRAVVIGAGGAGGAAASGASGQGVNGNLSSFGVLEAIGGGGGGGGGTSVPGSSGGSGGGGGFRNSAAGGAADPAVQADPTNTDGAGNNGGASRSGNASATGAGGGGGGAAAAGGIGTTSNFGGDGGDGVAPSWSTDLYGSGGGGGGGGSTTGTAGGAGGLSGGGTGGVATGSGSNGETASASTGGGGGGCPTGTGNFAGGTGGSGIVIVRWIRP